MFNMHLLDVLRGARAEEQPAFAVHVPRRLSRTRSPSADAQRVTRQLCLAPWYKPSPVKADVAALTGTALI